MSNWRIRRAARYAVNAQQESIRLIAEELKKNGMQVPKELRTTMTIGLSHFLIVAAILFTIGVLGIFINRSNVIVILMSIELMLLAVNINFVAFSVFQHNLIGQVFAMIVLTVAAAEAAIGLAILVVYFRNRGNIAVEDINLMKGEDGLDHDIAA